MTPIQVVSQPSTADSVVLRPQKNKRIAEHLLFTLITVGIFFLPIFFFPSDVYSIGSVKILFASALAALGLLVLFISSLSIRQYPFSRNLLFFTPLLLIIVFVISAVLAASFRLSFFGRGFEVSTVSVAIVIFALYYCVALSRQKKERPFYWYLAFLASFVLVFIFHLTRFFSGPGTLSLGFFTDPFSTPVGSWFDLAIFSGSVVLLSLITISLMPLSRFIKAIFYIILIAALLTTALIDFSFPIKNIEQGKFLSSIWIAIFFIAVILIVIELWGRITDGAKAKRGWLRNIPLIAVIICLISVVLVFGGSRLSNAAFAKRGYTQPTEVRPSIATTFEVAKEVLRSKPLLGPGPNQFVQAWAKAKPSVVNSSAFWNIDFIYGVGLLPTLAISTGILGTAAIALFLLTFLISGVRYLLRPSTDPVIHYLTVSSFLTSLFFWAFTIFYIPGPTILFLLAIFSGVFFYSLGMSERVRYHPIAIDRPRFTVIITTICASAFIIAAIFVINGQYTRVFAGADFEQALRVYFREGNVALTESLLLRASERTADDAVERALSELYLVKLGDFVANRSATLQPEDARRDFATLFNTAVDHARRAISINEANYLNWLALARVYDAVLLFNIEGAYQRAEENYLAALERAPKHPLNHINLGSLYLRGGELSKSKQYLDGALREKSNFTAAIFLLSQVEIQQGNIKEAISSVERALSFSPNDPVLHFQNGLLRYNERSFRDAAQSFERAVFINPSYANARYFLGLSYDRLGRRQDATREFQVVRDLNPDNAEVRTILRNLSEGRSALANLSATSPERRVNLPVSEEEDEEKVLRRNR